MVLPEGIKHLLEQMIGLGLDPYLVGGSTRDWLLQLPVRDWDVSFRGSPAILAELSAWDEVCDCSARAFGSITMQSAGQRMEVTLFRREGTYLDGRRPAELSFDASLEDDLRRRDYTLNALAWHVRGKKLIDLWGEVERLEQEPYVIRTCRPAELSLAEDGLRILRGFVLFGRLREAGRAVRFDSSVIRAMEQFGPVMKQASPFVLDREMQKIWNSSRAGDILEEMIRHGILDVLMDNQENKDRNRNLNWQRLNQPLNPLVRQTAFLAMMGYTPDVLQNSLGISRSRVAEMWELLQSLENVAGTDETGLKRVLAQLGSRKGAMLGCLLQVMDRKEFPIYDKMDRNRETIYLKNLALSGRDLMARGITGPQVGQILQDLLEEVHTGKTENRKDRLLQRADSLKGEYGRD